MERVSLETFTVWSEYASHCAHEPDPLWTLKEINKLLRISIYYDQTLLLEVTNCHAMIADLTATLEHWKTVRLLHPMVSDRPFESQIVPTVNRIVDKLAQQEEEYHRLYLLLSQVQNYLKLLFDPEYPSKNPLPYLGFCRCSLGAHYGICAVKFPMLNDALRVELPEKIQAELEHQYVEFLKTTHSTTYTVPVQHVVPVQYTETPIRTFPACRLRNSGPVF